MTKKIKRIWSWISGLLVAAVVVLAVALVGVRLIGLRPMYILSGSMEPTYPTGALIYVKEVDTAQLQAGDVITFMLNEDTVATHRIVEVVPDETDPSVLRFRTKGDANAVEDGGLVHYKNVIGSPVFSIPGLGYVAEFIQKPPGMYYALAFGAVLLLVLILPEALGDDGKKAKTGEKNSKSAPRHLAQKTRKPKG